MKIIAADRNLTTRKSTEHDREKRKSTRFLCYHSTLYTSVSPISVYIYKPSKPKNEEVRQVKTGNRRDLLIITAPGALLSYPIRACTNPHSNKMKREQYGKDRQSTSFYIHHPILGYSYTMSPFLSFIFRVLETLFQITKTISI